MAKEFNITTTGSLSPVPINDLGKNPGYTHPTVALDLLIEFSIDELLNSDDLQAAIDNGYILAVNEVSAPITDIESELSSGGSGDMNTSVYDTDTDTVVDNSELLEGQNSAYHLSVDNHTDGTTNRLFTGGDKTKLDSIDSNATDDQTPAEIKAAYELNANTNVFDDTEKTKLGTVQTGADATNATNVNAAGATMNTDASLTGNAYFLDEDNMVSNSPSQVPSQQSVKTYVDNEVSGAITGVFVDQGNYDANANLPDLDTTPIAGILRGHMYTVNQAGSFFTTPVEIGDVLRALVDNPTVLAEWAITQANLTAASIKAQYESNTNTNEFDDAEKTKLGTIETGAVNVRRDAFNENRTLPASNSVSDADMTPDFSTFKAAKLTVSNATVRTINAPATILEYGDVGTTVRVEFSNTSIFGTSVIFDPVYQDASGNALGTVLIPFQITNIVKHFRVENENLFTFTLKEIGSEETDPVFTASAANSITNAGSGQVITTVERNLLNSIGIDAYEVYEAGTTNIGALPVTIDFDTERSASSFFTLAAGVITVDVAITKAILTYSVNPDRTINNRAGVKNELYINGVIYPASASYSYHRTLATGEDTGNKTVTLNNLSIGDTIEVRSFRTSGTAPDLPTIANESNIVIDIKQV